VVAILKKACDAFERWFEADLSVFFAFLVKIGGQKTADFGLKSLIDFYTFK